MKELLEGWSIGHGGEFVYFWLYSQRDEPILFPVLHDHEEG